MQEDPSQASKGVGPRSTRRGAAVAVTRQQRKRERAERTRDAILEAAADTISELGFAATTMEQVAQRAGYSVGSLYNYFDSKVALIDAMAHKLIQDLVAALGRPIPSSLSALQRMEILVLRILDGVEASRGWILPVIEARPVQPSPNEDMSACLASFSDGVHRIIESHVREAMAEGAAREANPRIGAVFISSLLRGFLLDWLRFGGRGSATELAPRIVELIFDGIGNHPSTVPSR